MEEPAERKDATSGSTTKEPLKTEGLVPSPDTSERSEGASSPPPNCSICLGKLRNTSFTDSCLHQFCFTCLLQWSKIKTECPLCKQTFKSIIHNVRSEEDYDQYHVPRELASQMPPQQIASLDVNFELVGGGEGQIQRFVYRTTMTGNRRYNMILNPEQVARREQLPNMMASALSRDERRLRRADPTGYRRNVYQRGEWSNSLPILHGRWREHSAEFYRRHPQELDRLIPWINRELQILLSDNEGRIAYVLNVITDALTRYDIRGPEFRDTVRPYCGPNTDHFAHELLNYARTSLDLVSYDQYVTYPSRNRGLSSEYVGRVVSPLSSVSSTSSDDSDVRVIDQTIDVSGTGIEIPGVGPHIIDMPGPSTVGETFQLPRLTSAPDILTISSSSSSSDDCEVVGYVKPRHERTPEIIELASSDGGLEPANSRDASNPEPCEQQRLLPVDDEQRAGPSHDDRRRTSRKSVRPRRASIPRWSTTSGSNTNDPDPEPDEIRDSRKKICPRPDEQQQRRSRVRRTTRKRSTTSDEIIRPNVTRSRSQTRRRRAESSTSSRETVLRKNLRRGARLRALRQLGLAESETPSESCDDAKPNRSRSATSATSADSSSSGRPSNDDSIVRLTRRLATKIVNERPNSTKKRLEIYSTSDCTSEETSETESTNSNSENSEASNFIGCRDSSASPPTGDTAKLRRRRPRSRRKIVSRTIVDVDTRTNVSRRRQPVDATILRKNASKPNEWYVKKKSLRERSRSSSVSSTTSTSTDSSVPSSFSRRRIVMELRNADRRNVNDGIVVVDPGCSRRVEKKFCGTREKREESSDESTSDDRSAMEMDERSTVDIDGNGRGCGISGRTRAKERSRRKSGTKRRKIRSESSDSERSRPIGGANARRRDQETRNDQARRKERGRSCDRGRKRERPSKSNDRGKKNDQARRENRERNNEQSCRNDRDRKKDATPKKHDHGKKHVDQDRRNGDQDRRSGDHDRKNVDHDRKNVDHDRKNVDHDRKNVDHDRKNVDHDRKNVDHDRKTGDHDRKMGDHDRKIVDQERNNVDQGQSSDQTRKNNDQASRSNGARKKDNFRRNDEDDDDDDDDDEQTGNSKHSETEKKSIAKDKHKRRKKQKTKRRRSRSESKSESRNSRHRAKRSSSYSAPATNRDDQ